MVIVYSTPAEPNETGETGTLSVPVRVGSWTARTGAAEMEAYMLREGAAGTSDEAIAQHLTAQGYRSPMADVVLPSTVRGRSERGLSLALRPASRRKTRCSSTQQRSMQELV